MTELARQRWRMLGEILLSKHLGTSSEHEDISVMRFKTYGLYVRSLLNFNNQDDGTWCKIEFPTFEDQQSNILSLDIRLCSTKIDYADLIGFNNTGNTCIWPSEEVLAYYCLKEKELFENKSVCELGGGMTCLAGLALAQSISLRELVATDGNEKSIANLNAILRAKTDWLCPIESRVLLWNRQLNDPTLKERFDLIISADCFFFEDLHHDLCHTIYFMLKDSGVAINFAPYRSKTLHKFVAIAQTYPFECTILENYDEDVFNKHLQTEQINKHYSRDLHYPILVLLRKRLNMKLSRHKFIRRLLNYYRTHFHLESPFVILIDGTFAFEALQWKIQIDEQLKAYLETDQIICSTTLCAIRETELLGGIGFGAMLILKQYQIIKCDHYPSISAEKCFEQILIKDQTKKYFLASQSSTLRDYSHDHRPDLPTMLITHNSINLERPSLHSRSIVEENKRERLNISQHESNVLNKIKHELHLDDNDNNVIKKKKKKHGINPLAIKKKTKKNATNQSINDQKIVKKKRRRTRQLRILISIMLTLFLLAFHSAKLTIPIVSLFGSAPTFFTCWSTLRLITLICFPRHIYRRCDDQLYSTYQRFVLFFFQNCVNVKIYLHGDHEEIFEKKENVLYISNHQSSVDWVIANMLAIRQGSLGHIRYVLKNELKWIPLYGFYFQQHGCIYVRRNDKGDLDRVEKGMRQIVYNGLPVWLVIFPEGTRYNPMNNQHAIQNSQIFAQQKGLSTFDHVLYPRSGATIAAIRALKTNLDAVYDVTLMYNQTYDNDRQIRLAAPTMAEYLQGQTTELHIDIRRIAMNEIPTETNEEISNWLYERFDFKDKLLTRFYDYQRNKTLESIIFHSDGNDLPIEIHLPLNETIYATLFFTLTTIPLLFSERGRSIYWKLCLFSTPITLLWMHLFPPTKHRN